MQGYIVDGWITVYMTEEERNHWNAGDIGDDVWPGLEASTPDGESGPLAELVARGVVTEEQLRSEAR